MDLTTFQILGQNLSNFFVGILAQTMTPKGHFEINWPLVDLQVASLCSTYVNPICISKVKSNIMQSSTQFFVQLNSGKLIYSLWLEMGNLNHLLFGMILNLDIGLLHPSGLLRHEISQKKWKRPKKFLKATSKTR